MSGESLVKVPSKTYLTRQTYTMARQEGGPIKVKGKLGDTIYTRRGKYGSTVRKVVKAGTKKEEEALKEQYNRTQYLNVLASDVNTMISAHSELLKSGQFYVDVQRKFRKEPLNHRLLLLYTLRGLEVHPKYPFRKQGKTIITAIPKNKGLQVQLQVAVKPEPEQFPVDSYCYEIMVATWTKKEEPGDCEQQFSEWVLLSEGRPEFEFFFAKPPGALHWMVAVRIRLGKDGVPHEDNQCDGMIIADAGSFDAREQHWLQTREPQLVRKETKSRRREPQEVVRVKAKRFD
jgi:hypothetical protein